MDKYLLDTNVLLDAHDRIYPMSVFPNLWEWISTSGKFYITKKVYNELTSIDSNFNTWLENNFRDRLVDEEQEPTIKEYKNIVEFLTESSYWSEAGYNQWIESSKKADPWLISYAMSNKEFCIISHEKLSSPDKKAKSNKEPKIPFVAKQMNIKVLTLWQVMNQEGFHD